MSEEIEILTRQNRRLTERNASAFDQGFTAATRMVEAGADVERLREASGIVAVAWADTQPCLRIEVDFEDEVTGVWTRT